MLNPVEEQKQIISMLYEAIISASDENFDRAACRFDYDHGYEDGSSSVGIQLTFFLNEKPLHTLLGNDEAFDLVPKLHASMKAHTGGDWNAFTLFINEDGSVTTKFEYPEEAKNSRAVIDD